MPKNPLHVGKVLDGDGNTALLPILAGTHTTAGGDASETITVEGVTSADYALVYISAPGATPRTLNGYVTDNGSINVTMSGDPSTDHVLSYVVFRTSA